MPWSNDQFDGSITLPTGSTSGRRIVLDGASIPASITVYDENDVIVAQMTTDLPNFTGDDGGFYTIDATSGKTAALIGDGIAFGDDTHTMVLTPNMTWEYVDSVNPDVPRLKLISGRVDNTQDYARVYLDASTTGIPAGVIMSANTADVADLQLIVYGDIHGLRDLHITRDSYINGVDQGRGLKDFTCITASAAGVTTTETVGITSGSVDFEDDRAYRVSVKGYLQSSVAADTVRFLIKKTNAAGQQFFDSFRTYVIQANNQQAGFSNECILKNVSGATVTASLVLTYVRGSGTGTVFLGANATNPAWMRIEDIGAAADYPDVNAIT